MGNWMRLGSAALLVLSLSACSIFSDDDAEIQVAPLPDLDNKFEPEVVWETGVGDGVGDYFSRLRPTLAYNKLYAASRFGDVVALDPETGDVIWEQDVALVEEGWLFDSRRNAMVAGGLSAAYGKLFLGTEKGLMIALDAETGERAWQVELNSEILSPATVDQGVVLVNTGSGKLYALDAEDGSELWVFQQEMPSLTLRGLSSAATAQGGVIVGKANGKLSALSLANGIEFWQQASVPALSGSDLERIADIDADPIVLGATLYSVAYNGFLQALDLRSGRVLWKREYSSYRGFNLSPSAGSLYLTDFRGHIYAINSRNGLEDWRYGELDYRSVTEPVVVKDYIVVGDFESYLHWLDRRTGEPVARMEVDDDGVYVAPVVDGDMLYVQARDGTVSAIRTP